MGWIKKGDLLRVNGKVVIANSDDYTKIVYDDHDLELTETERGAGKTVSCVNVIHTDNGILQTIRLDVCQVEKVGREFP